MFTRILVPVDGSTCASSAVDVAIDLAKLQGARLTIVNVVDPAKAALASMDPYGGTAIPWLEALTEDGKTLLNEASERARRAGVTLSATHLLNGNAVEQIAATAAEEACDLIVIGSHGRSGLSRLVLGSVAEGVMRETSVPTLIVHEARARVPQQQFAAAV
jgi:nucleotide-binding universal stress UspA family protein